MNVVAIAESSKSDEEGKLIVSLKVTVSGRDLALKLAALNGKQVDIARQNGEVVDVGIVRAGSLKKRTKEEDDEIDGTAKIVGGKALQKCVGVLLILSESKLQPNGREPELPEVGRNAKSPWPSRPAPKEDETCAEDGCGHPWSKTKNPKRDKDGHGRQSGECYVAGCNCRAFMPVSRAGS